MKRLALITSILGTALAIAPVASAIVLSDGSGSKNKAVVPATRPVGVSPAEYRALLIRGEGLNKLYGNAVTRLTPAQFGSLYRNGGDRLAPQELAALVSRSEALNARYGNHITDLTPQQFKAAYEAGIAWAHATPSGTSEPTGSSFDWRYVEIAVLGAMLVALAGAAITRRRHRLSF